MIKPPAPGKDNAPDFQMKKEFIEKQLALKRYADDVERLALADIIRDPLVVHTLEDYAEMYREQDNLRQIKSTIKNLYKIKRKNVDISPLLRSLEVPNVVEERSDMLCIKANPSDSERRSIFRPIAARGAPTYSKDLALGDFKRHLKRISGIKKLPITQPTFTRTLSVSTSHNHLIKKLEKQDSPAVKESVSRPTNEITSATSFRNGILKPSSAPERALRTADASKTQGATGVRIQQILHPEHFNIQRPETSSGRQPGTPPAQKKKAPRSASEEAADKPRY